MPRKTDVKRAEQGFLPGESSARYQARGLPSVQPRTMGEVLVLEAVPSAGRVRPRAAGQQRGGGCGVGWGRGVGRRSLWELGRRAACSCWEAPTLKEGLAVGGWVAAPLN